MPPISARRRPCCAALSPALLGALLRAMVDAGALRELAGRFMLAGHRPRLAPADERVFARMERHLAVEDLRPPRVAEIAEALGLPAPTVAGVLQRAARLGLACRIAANRYALPATVEGLAAVAQRLVAAAPDARFSAAAFRDASHIGRNLTIEVLEFLDRIGFTRREGEGRAIVSPIGACLAALAGGEA